jgi:phosphoglycerol transferase MdoB-like AlkP superfamily enzyme
MAGSVVGKLVSRWKFAPGFWFFALQLVIIIVFAGREEIRWLGYIVVVAFSVFAYCLFRLLFIGPILSSILSVSLILTIFVVSKLKFLLTARRLHPFDIYEYGSWRNLSYIQDLYPHHYHYVYLVLIAAVSAVLVILFFERFVRPGAIHVIGFVVILAGFAGFSHSSRYLDGGGFGDGNRFMHFDHQHVSTFLIAGIESFQSLLAGKSFEYGPDQALDTAMVEGIRRLTCNLPASSRDGRANTADPLPNVVAILRESATIPSRFPQMNAPDVNESRFASADGQTHLLRVETHGAGSAHTIFSLMSGISTEAFGNTKMLAPDLSATHLNYSLPKQMKACGYQTIAISAGEDGYVVSREFYRGIGFDAYYDLKDVVANDPSDLSDRAFYKFLNERLSEKDGAAPLFVYLDTTINHAPYDTAVRKEEAVDETRNIPDPVVAEWVRRIIIGERDLDKLLQVQTARNRQGSRATVVLDFGDHQPYFTKSLPGEPGYVVEDPDQDDPLLITYFRIRSAGYTLDLDALSKDHPLVDVAFLSDWLLRALGWKPGGVYDLRWKTVEHCKSRYWRCDDHAAAHQLHQYLRAAGLISFR